MYLDRRRCGETAFHPNFAVRHSVDWDEAALLGRLLRLHIFLDRQCIEIFAGNGERYLPALIFPAAPQAAENSFFVEGDAPLMVACLRVYGYEKTSDV